MKIKLLLILGLIVSLASCGKMYEYKHLDGMWQMRSIEYENGDIEKPEQLYYSFQLHVIKVKKIHTGEFYGSFTYVDDSICVKFDKNISIDRMKLYGMNSTEQHFCVEQLTSDRMVLKSDYSRLEFRKY